MSPWRRRLTTEPIPVVPDDRDIRVEAIEQSARGLADALKQVPAVTAATSRIEKHNLKNHYAIRIRETYGGA